jgi:hypothetical protein
VENVQKEFIQGFTAMAIFSYPGAGTHHFHRLIAEFMNKEYLVTGWWILDAGC